MAKIKVNDIKPAGAELFDGSESFMNELKNDELEQAMGGIADPLQGTGITVNSPLCINSLFCDPIILTIIEHYAGPGTPVIL